MACRPATSEPELHPQPGAIERTIPAHSPLHATARLDRPDSLVRRASPYERNFTGDRRRRLANGQNEKLDFLLNYKEQFTEGDIQFNSSFNTPFATHKLTYGAYASVAETDYARRDITTNLTTGVVTVANAGGFNFADATTKRADGFIQDEIESLRQPLDHFAGRSLRYL